MFCTLFQGRNIYGSINLIQSAIMIYSLYGLLKLACTFTLNPQITLNRTDPSVVSEHKVLDRTFDKNFIGNNILKKLKPIFLTELMLLQH